MKKNSLTQFCFVVACMLCSVSQATAALELRIDSVTAATASQIAIPVRVFDFNQIIGVQGSIEFDVNVMSFDTVQQFGLPGMTISDFGLAQAGNGRISYAWSDATLNGVSLPDSAVIFEIVFQVTAPGGQQSSLCFGNTPTVLEAVDLNFAEIQNVVYRCGSMQASGGTGSPVGAISAEHVSCFGFADGEAAVSVSGGIPPYRYAWSSGDTTASVSNLTAGTYTVTITDSTGQFDIVSVSITEPAALALSFAITDVTSCTSSDGSAAATVTGGTPPYAYGWTTGDTTSAIQNMPAGEYLIMVVDINNCIVSGNAIIAQPSAVIAQIDETRNITCFGGNDGSITAQATGGVAPYSYTWSSGADSSTASGLLAGTHSVTVADQNNCTASASAMLLEPDQLEAEVGVADVTCFGEQNGSASVAVLGGVPPYTYQWSSGATTDRVNDLAAGIYTVTVIDTFNCSVTASDTISQPPALIVSDSVFDVSVFVENDWIIDIRVFGGSGDYEFVWSGGSTEEDLMHIGAGIYSVTVNDANGCTGTTTVTIIPTGLQELPSEAIMVYPNPNRGNFIVSTQQGIDDTTSIEIFNVFGQIVFSERKKNAERQTEVFMPETGAGIYILRVTAGGKMYFNSILIQH